MLRTLIQSVQAVWPAAILLAAFLASSSRGDEADFAKQVAPLLRERCVQCHNKDKLKGGLNLSTRTSLLQGGLSGPAVIPGKSSESLLIEIVSGSEPAMPKGGKRLTANEIDVLRRWIDKGAVWPAKLVLDSRAQSKVGPDWWSLRPLSRPPGPDVRNSFWVKTPVDAYILAALEAKGLVPSPPADRKTLLRRLTFDLHGLPPTPEEVADFLSDPAPDAYERVVERLLASPRYGERWGRHWLDVIHYGDTHGFDKDKRRDNAWPYRDYVISSFNGDKRYDRFILEQLAGDVLWPSDPQAAVATGFIAAGPWDFVGHVELREGTVDKEKTRLLDRDDMVSNAIGSFMSLTIHCARCHDHKFDPITKHEYYQLQAAFAGVDRGDRPYTTPEGARRLAQLENHGKNVKTRLAELERKVAALTSPQLDRVDQKLKRLREDLGRLPAQPAAAASPTNGYHSQIAPAQDTVKWVQIDLGRPLAIEQIRLIPARPTDFPDTPGFGFPLRFQISISDSADFKDSRSIVDKSTEDFANPADTPVVFRLTGRRGRYVRITANRLWKRTGDFVFALAELQVESGGRNVARGANVTALDSIEAGRWSNRHLVDNFDSRVRLPDSGDAEAAALFARRTELLAAIQETEPLRRRLAKSLIDAATQKELDEVRGQLARNQSELQALAAATKVYAVLSHAPRTIYNLNRGDVEQRGEQVVPGGLTCIPGLDATWKLTRIEDEGSRRAALAQWVAHAGNSLTWRSIANRLWHYHFGRGIVDTPNDFGWNGGRPSHPELLDWLATELRDGGASIKKLHRLIVLSSTYRQTSEDRPDHAGVDSDNRLLWRMNRLRLEAEDIRDSILAVSGALNSRMGGPGFELFRFKDDHSPIYDHGAIDRINDAANWRRTVYRFTVRSVPNPFLECLDCADPNLNTPVRAKTVTALQALALLNDPFVVRQSEIFADRIQRLAQEPARQINEAYSLAFGRLPLPEERAAMLAYVARHGLANGCRLLFNTNEFMFID